MISFIVLCKLIPLYQFFHIQFVKFISFKLVFSDTSINSLFYLLLFKLHFLHSLSPINHFNSILRIDYFNSVFLDTLYQLYFLIFVSVRVKTRSSIRWSSNKSPPLCRSTRSYYKTEDTWSINGARRSFHSLSATLRSAVNISSTTKIEQKKTRTIYRGKQKQETRKIPFA